MIVKSAENVGVTDQLSKEGQMETGCLTHGQERERCLMDHQLMDRRTDKTENVHGMTGRTDGRTDGRMDSETHFSHRNPFLLNS